MANYCEICDRRWPPEPVIMIVLGDNWHEFCAECVDTPDYFKNSQTGESLSPRQLFDSLSKEQEKTNNAL